MSRNDRTLEEYELVKKISDLIKKRYPTLYKSVRELSHASYINEKTMRNILLEKHIPSFLTLVRVSKALAYDNISDFLKEAGC